MRRLKKNLRNIETAVFVVLGISLLYLSFTEIAVLIQLPSARGDFLFVFGAGCIIVLSGFSLLMVKRITRTKIKRESGLFVLFVVLVSLLTFVFFNIFLKIGITASQLITLSIIVSTPLSCLAAGQTKKTFMDRLRRLGLNQGITLLTIFILATMPILPKWSFYFPQTAYVLPDLAFLNTPRTPSVNGEINSSGFFAEISVYENHTFEADNITQLTITNIGNNSVDLHFSVRVHGWFRVPS